jgi:hypothetical protein
MCLGDVVGKIRQKVVIDGVATSLELGQDLKRPILDTLERGNHPINDHF